MKVLGVIPARYASSRFPGKPLVDIHGKSMIERVYDQASQAKSLSEVVVATDDERIFSHCSQKEIPVVLTSDKHKSGTDRCAEVALGKHADVVVNIQGDEPFLDPKQIEQAVALFENSNVNIATLVKPEENSDVLRDPNRVKCVMSETGQALYFSRSLIPFKRNDIPHTYYRHVGLYAYRKATLLELAQLCPSKNELIESLEQLRWLDNGYQIHTAITEIETPNVDTPEDLENILKNGQ